MFRRSAIVRELTDSELADFTNKFSSVKPPDSMPKIYTRTGDKGFDEWLYTHILENICIITTIWLYSYVKTIF